MNNIMEAVAGMCTVLIGVEIIGRLCPKETAVQFTKGLVVLALVISAAAALFSMDIDFTIGRREAEAAGEELGEYIQGQYREAAQREVEEYLVGLLMSAGIEAEKIEAEIDIQGEDSIILTKVRAEFTYETEAHRAETLLKNALGEETEIEVAADGA